MPIVLVAKLRATSPEAADKIEQGECSTATVFPVLRRPFSYLTSCGSPKLTSRPQGDPRLRYLRQGARLPPLLPR